MDKKQTVYSSSRKGFLKTQLKLKGFLFFILTLTLSNGANAQNAVFEWVNQIAGATVSIDLRIVNNDRSVVTDGQGNVYNIGMFSKTVNFKYGTGTNTLNAADGNQFVTKYDQAGNFIWAKQFGNALANSAKRNFGITSIGLDSSGHIYLGGYYSETFDLNPGTAVQSVTSSGGNDLFIIKLDSAGNHVWGKSMGGAANDKLFGMAVDPAGNVYATGVYEDEINFNPGGTAAILKNYGTFILKMKTNGDYEWSKGISGLTEGYSIAVDDWGNVLTTGYFYSDPTEKVDFNPGMNASDTFFFSSFGDRDIFILKLNSKGNFVWAKQMGGKGFDESYSIATDESGAVYTTGAFSDKADFNPGSGNFYLTAEGANIPVEAFVSKLDSAGNFVWAKQTKGAAKNTWGTSIAVRNGKNDGVYITGKFADSVIFQEGAENGTLKSKAGVDEAFVLKYDTDGNFGWVKQIGANLGQSIAIDETNNIFTSGTFFSGVVDFDPGVADFPVGKIGSVDRFIHKMSFCITSDTLVVTACKEFVYDDVSYTTSGVYTLPVVGSCDSSSVLILDLTIYDLNPIITIREFELGTQESYTTYQWMVDDSIIVGATDSIYNVTKNGFYTVIVTDEAGCVDTSEAYEINNTSISDQSNLAKQIRIYPNPSRDVLHIASPMNLNLYLYSIEGKLFKQSLNTKQISINELSEGVYFLQIYDQKGSLLKVEKIIKAP